MAQAFGCLIFLLLALLLIILSPFVVLLQRIFGLSRRDAVNGSATSGKDQSYGPTSAGSTRNSNQNSATGQPGKIFTSDEGEYVDFEEVKE